MIFFSFSVFGFRKNLSSEGIVIKYIISLNIRKIVSGLVKDKLMRVIVLLDLVTFIIVSLFGIIRLVLGIFMKR